MRILLIFCVALYLTSCSGGSADQQLSGADSVVINFNVPQSDEIANTVNTTERNAIKKLKQFVGGKKGEEYKCGYNGNLQFYVKGALVGDFSFNYSDSCKHFIQLKEGKLSSTTMNNEAADFLKSLAEGKNWY